MTISGYITKQRQFVVCFTSNFSPKSRDQTPVSCVRMMINETASSRQSSPPPTHDFDKFNFLPHVLNLLNLIQSDADTGAVSQEVPSKQRIALSEIGSKITTRIS